MTSLIARGLCGPARLAPIAAAALVALLDASPQQDPVFKSSVEIVTVHATVRDKGGRLVPLLPRDDFELLVDGKRVDIAAFANNPRPITAALMIDTSESMIGRLLWARDAGLALVNALGPNDRLRLGSFGHEAVVSPHLTGDPAILRRVLNSELWPGGATPLWDALQTAISSIEKEEGRRAVLTISDGMGMAMPSEIGLTPRMLDRALDSGVIVYAVGGMPNALGLLKEIAEKTGGGYIRRPDAVDVATLMRQIVNELRHEYLIGFVPPVPDGREHSLSVRVRQGGMTVVAPRKFLAQRKRP